jgi:hypothetical protein
MPEITPSKYLVTASWDDVPHLDEKTKRELWDATPEYMRDARSKGLPTLGSGAIFPIKEEFIKCAPFEIPKHWPRIAGMDFGWDHPTAASWLAYDQEGDIVYLYDCYAASKTLIPVHASAIKARGKWIPMAWPHDGYQVKDAMTGDQLAKQYGDEEVNMLSTHAQFASTGGEDEKPQSLISVEAGIQDMLTRMQTGRFKVFNTLGEWFSEYRLYRREKGKIVKLFDDRISSTRYALMMLRFAITEPAKTNFVRNKINWRA